LSFALKVSFILEYELLMCNLKFPDLIWIHGLDWLFGQKNVMLLWKTWRDEFSLRTCWENGDAVFPWAHSQSIGLVTP